MAYKPISSYLKAMPDAETRRSSLHHPHLVDGKGRLTPRALIPFYAYSGSLENLWKKIEGLGYPVRREQTFFQHTIFRANTWREKKYQKIWAEVNPPLILDFLLGKPPIGKTLPERNRPRVLRLKLELSLELE